MPLIDATGKTTYKPQPVDFGAPPQPLDLPPYYVAAPGAPSQPPPAAPPVQVVDRQEYWTARHKEQQDILALQQQQEQENQRQRLIAAKARNPALQALGTVRNLYANAGRTAEAVDRQGALQRAQQAPGQLDAETAGLLARGDSEGLRLLEQAYAEDATPQDIAALQDHLGKQRDPSSLMDLVINPVREADIPGMKRVQSAVGTGVSAAVEGVTGSERVGDFAAGAVEALVPTTVGALVLELLPGIGGVPGLISMARKGGPEWAAAASKLSKSESGQRVLKALREGEYGGGSVIPGMGADEAADAVDPVETLIKAKTSEDIGKANFIQKIVDQVSGGRTYLSPASRAERATGERVLEQSKNIVVKYSGAIQQTIPREAGLEARALRREMGDVTQDQLRSITGALDDFDDATRARFLAKLTPEQSAVYETMRSNIDATGDLLVVRGILDPESRVNNYFTHILDFVDEGKRSGTGGGLRTPIKKPRNAIVTGKRTQGTVVDDIVKGYRPATLDPVKIYEQFMVEARTRMAMADIIDDIRHFDPEGVQFLKPGQAVPDGFSTVRHPMFEGQVAINAKGGGRAPTIEGAPLETGAIVHAADKGNYGKVASYNPSATHASVYFRSREGLEATVDLPVSMLRVVGRPGTDIAQVGTPIILRYRWAVRDNVARYVKSLVEPSAIRGSAAGRAALTATSSIKRTVLGAPLDINFAGFEIKAASYAVGSDIRKILPAAFKTALMGQEKYDGYLLAEVEYLGRKMPRTEMYKRLDEAGLTGGSYRTEISRMLGDEPTSTLIGLVPGPGKWYDAAQGFMEARQFDRMIPTLKHETAALLVAKKLRGKMVVTDSVLKDAERQAANDINTAMGGLNRVAQGRSKTAQDIAALVAIAPDWLESRLSLYAGAMLPGSKNATSRRFMARAMIGGAVTTAAGSAIYAHERGWDDEQTARYIAQNMNPVVVRDGKPQINIHFMEFQLPGTGQWTSPLSWEKDGWKVLFGAYAAATGDREGFDMTLGNYLSSRFGVVPRLAKDAISNRDYRGLPITKKGGWAGIAEWLKYEAAQTAVPSVASGFGQAFIPGYPGGEQTLTGAVQNVSGIGRARPISPTDTLDRSVQDEHIPSSGGGEYMHYRDLPNDIKGEFNKRHVDEVAEVEQSRAERGTDTFDLLRQETAAGLAGLAPMAETEKATYREQVGDFVMQRSAVMQHELEQLRAEGVSFSDRSGDLGLLDSYFDAVESATDQTTRVTDFDKRDALEEKFRADLTATEKERLDAMLVYSSDPTYQKLKLAKKELNDSSYFQRQDDAFGGWVKALTSGASIAPSVKVEAESWTSPDALRQSIQAKLAAKHIPVENYTIDPYWKAWQHVYDGKSAHFLATTPGADALAVEWGYQSNVHSAAACTLYKERTGATTCPVPE